MSTLLPIAPWGEPILQQSTKPTHITPELAVLAQDMLATMTAVNGVGIAAPQVYRDERLFIVASRPNPRYPDAPEMPPEIMLNPEILHASEEAIVDWEGCLSLPGLVARVPRAAAVHIRYQDLNGDTQENHLSGFIARIFLHEHDHLEGLCILDRVRSSRDIVSRDVYEKRYLSGPVAAS